MKYPLQELQNVFFNDPRWAGVEDLIKEFIEPLLDMSTIDVTQPSENVKAEIIGRTYAYNCLSDFLNQTKVGSFEKKKLISNPFK